MKRAVGLIFSVLLLVNGGNFQLLPASNRPQILANMFQVPLQALAQRFTILGNLIPPKDTARPFPGPPSSDQSQNYNFYGRPTERSRAARIAGLYVAPDGSGFKI